MERVLWTEKFKPRIDQFPQDDVRDQLKAVSETTLNIIVSGSVGVGKTVATEEIVDNIHSDTTNDVKFVNISDLFNKTKKELVNNSQFGDIAKNYRNHSKRDIVVQLIKEVASYPPVTGGFKTIVLDNMAAAREDFQQALRRIMETFSDGTQFILTTRSPASLIEPIKSRCYRVQVRPPTSDELHKITERIAESEDVQFSDSVVDYVWSQNKPNLRKFLLHLQTTAYNYDEITTSSVADLHKKINRQSAVHSILEETKNRNYKTAKDSLEDLVSDEGYTADQAVQLIISGSIDTLSESECKELVSKISEEAVRIGDSTDPIQLIMSVLTSWNEEVSHPQ